MRVTFDNAALTRSALRSVASSGALRQYVLRRIACAGCRVHVSLHAGCLQSTIRVCRMPHVPAVAHAIDESYRSESLLLRKAARDLTRDYWNRPGAREAQAERMRAMLAKRWQSTRRSPAPPFPHSYTGSIVTLLYRIAERSTRIERPDLALRALALIARFLPHARSGRSRRRRQVAGGGTGVARRGGGAIGRLPQQARIDWERIATREDGACAIYAAPGTASASEA